MSSKILSLANWISLLWFNLFPYLFYTFKPILSNGKREQKFKEKSHKFVHLFICDISLIMSNNWSIVKKNIFTFIYSKFYFSGGEKVNEI